MKGKNAAHLLDLADRARAATPPASTPVRLAPALPTEPAATLEEAHIRCARLYSPPRCADGHAAVQQPDGSVTCQHCTEPTHEVVDAGYARASNGWKVRVTHRHPIRAAVAGEGRDG